MELRKLCAKPPVERGEEDPFITCYILPVSWNCPRESHLILASPVPIRLSFSNNPLIQRLCFISYKCPQHFFSRVYNLLGLFLSCVGQGTVKSLSKWQKRFNISINKLKFSIQNTFYCKSLTHTHTRTYKRFILCKSTFNLMFTHTNGCLKGNSRFGNLPPLNHPFANMQTYV